jgi:hypothetical protein
MSGSFSFPTLHKLEQFIEQCGGAEEDLDEVHNVLTVERYKDGSIADAYWICSGCGKRIRFGEGHSLKGTPNRWGTPVRLCTYCWILDAKSRVGKSSEEALA